MTAFKQQTLQSNDQQDSQIYLDVAITSTDKEH